jgi:hypothetical protein
LSDHGTPTRNAYTRRGDCHPAAPGFRSIVRYAQRWGFLAKDETGEEIFCGVFAPSPRSANDRASHTSKVVSFGALSDEKKAAWEKSPWQALKKSAITRRNPGVSRGSLGKLSVAAIMTNQPDLTENNPDPIEIPTEMLEELEAWERASDEAWQMIERMEEEEGFESW